MLITSTSHPGVSVDTDSPAFAHFLKWLSDNGAPTPTVEDGPMDAFGVQGPQELWFRANGNTFRGEALAIYLSPSMALTTLQEVFNFGDPFHSVPYPPYVVPVQSKPAPTAPKPVALPPGDDDGYGHLQVMPGDTLPVGETQEVNGIVYVKKGRRSPFGVSLWYEVAAQNAVI